MLGEGIVKRLHLEKKGLRGLSIAESFKQDSKKSILAGVVMRNDFIIDGFVIDKTTLEGDDAVEVIVGMYNKLQRTDINYLLISGIIISMYNIVRVREISDLLQLPVIGVTYHDSIGIEDAIRYHFPSTYEKKLTEYRNLGQREKITLHTSYNLYLRKEGCSLPEAKRLLDRLTLQGSIPEPLRVAQLLAKSISTFD